ncbi:laminin subunit gamma-3 isoform X1 [Notolabrus celidotus]|uniref:laminin subunit gamma-3 isoform X1 n=3 Tax=Notolabrus celidotus TaxID=1203425 RepID=UPI00148F568C|nr:laminin subunit gamma-3 isoform X1 [Notolabrus celidotus]XP_034565302.1 laminin subunit gamma-3 isoform X1 [Notolabrus celidotus]XP_034565303.1 laminin subunit gamma-3 isoform X1 [Notolabrus celidotus]XP_034565305.1 laminin subunit gamma-3 isoform X1 [Notolabrus celidotus]XP_034565306.1 laminin subunit gamma-3 isoform X1 [Notolabrus celidotus]XP_034565307.1 laminin subunit gamma-3 isoform X1 [Notolabrus celidotus]XP_034565308.1 laminin subunit gamma-3 isoform X1 [Notolabrus celidotus]XP_0
MDVMVAVSSVFLALLLSLHLHHNHLFVQAAMDSCYDDEGAPSRCMPKFENIAFNRTVVASNVCGTPPEDYCMQTGSTRSCHHCDASDPDRNHNASLLTDFHRNEESTWWQSQSMFYGIQHPNSVKLTLNLGKAFDISYIRLKFYTSRPESFAIYKRTQEDGPWLPYQYYSASCTKTYQKDATGFMRLGDDERTGLCTDDFSDISPLTGGSVAFSTLEGRPSAYNFDQSLGLQEWVTATDLLISLDRLNTFGDEFFKDAKVLRSYFYAISDFAVGGRCKCNGHASECVQGEHGGLVCSCQHHTEGDDCQRCHPFFQDRPWARATGDSANECLKCNCSGRADECVFDMEQYRSTGSGGRCVSCRDNTDGPHCERCRENHYRRSAEEPCLPCNCNVDGSVSLQCDVEGRCACRVGVTGEKCDTCQAGFHSLGPGGCRPCECDPSGSVDVCSPLDGRCRCKTNVEGQSCDRCKPGFFNLQQVNQVGCQACFCFGHSLACTSSGHYTAVNITSDFTEDQDGWVGKFSAGQEYPLLWKEGEVYLLPLTEEDIGFYKAPEKFLGHQAFSYGQLLSITFTSESVELLPYHVTLLLFGSGITLLADLSPQPVLNYNPGLAPQHSFIVRLHENERRFKPSLSAFEFQHLLYNLTALSISNAGGHNYTSQLAKITLTSAFISSSPAGPPAPWVEFCSCPLGFAGQFCEQCAAGFTRENPGRGPLSPCVPCNCHQHGTCHPETGVCECSDFTTGVTCEHCLDGYYGNALIGTPGDCQPCPCPDRTSCAQIATTGQVVCTNCPAGQTGMRCQMCEDGYYGDPLGQSGQAQACVRCDCNGNVDFNALGICDHISGRCLKCLGHTEGDHCERCQRGYYGDALNRTAGKKCKACACNPGGTSGHMNECHPQTGSCRCLGHVTGRDCSYCEVGYFNLQHGVGCERCQCNPVGSSSIACHPVSGQCLCHAGVEGRLCDSCRVGFFGFSSRGCRACNCDPMGSISMQCHSNGTCHCRQGFVGYKCDQCEMNYFHNRATHQCEECPVCYSLVKKQAEKLRTRLQDLEKLLARYDCRGRSGKQHHLLKYHMARLYEHEHQREDTLPNALEDFLAFQEAREAFIKQFSLLEASTGTLLAQLHSITSTLNCSISMTEEEREESRKDEGSRAVCQTFTETISMIRGSQKQLKQATLDLDSMIIPFELESGPNKWNMMVNDSQVLMKSHRETADYIEAVASGAVQASKQTFSFLMDLLQDNSTEEYIRNLTEQIKHMQQQKANLTAQVNDTVAKQLALEEEDAGLKLALGNITSSFHQLALTAASSSPQPAQTQLNQTQPANHTGEWGEDLIKQTEELDGHIQTKDDLINKIREKTETLKQTTNEKIETMVNDVSELQARTEGAKVTALSSVVTGKEMESDAITLHRELDHMMKEWPNQHTQTQAAIKKEKPLEDKVLADVRRKVSQIERMLKPALETSSLASNTTKEAEQTAQAVAKESKGILTQAKHTRTASTHLGSHLNSALRQLAEQETLTATANSQINSQPEVSLTRVKEDMEAAKLQLKAFSVTLTELISKIDGNVPLERFDRILNETARRLSMLRGSVESPTLGSKIQKLQSASKEQQSRLSMIEQDLQEIREERDSLRDIAVNLPQSCPEATAAGKG